MAAFLKGAEPIEACLKVTPIPSQPLAVILQIRLASIVRAMRPATVIALTASSASPFTALKAIVAATLSFLARTRVDIRRPYRFGVRT